jgi:N-methylhydantoinase B
VWGVLEHIGSENMRPGDVYIMNDPYIGGTHNNDVRLVKPIFLGEDIVGFVATTGHWSDVGGTVPGSLFVMATDAYQEGVRITPTLIEHEGELNKPIVDLMLANMRVPAERRGDLNAQIAACAAGERRLIELIGKYGWETVHLAMLEVQDYAERLFRAEMAALPDGIYEWEDFVDQDITTGQPARVHLCLTIDGDQATYDFSRSDDVARCSINATYSGLVSCLFIATKAVFSHIPLNYGLLRALDIVARENSIVYALHPSPVSGMGATAFEKIMNCVVGVYSKLVPDLVMACPSNLMNVTFGGSRPDGSAFVGYVWTEGGLGATAKADGVNATSSFFNASTMNIPVEVQERSIPLLWDSYCFRQDSAGPGEHQGGTGVERILHMEHDHLRLSSIGDRGRFHPWGLFGGGEAPNQGVILYAADGSTESLGVFFANRPVGRDDRVRYFSTGGGGYGPPERRRLDQIVEHVRDEFISPAYALTHYGVVIEWVDREALTLTVDLEATYIERARRFGAEFAKPIGVGAAKES